MSDHSHFSIHTRIKKKGPIFYVQFKDENGHWSTAKSTGILDTGRRKDYQAAVNWARDYLERGKVIAKEHVTVAKLATNFFAWEGSWATNKRVAQKRISARQCEEKQAATDRWIIPYLGEKPLQSLDKLAIRTFRNTLFEQGLSGSRINKVLSCLKSILEYAEEKRYIQAVPTIERAGDKGRSRGILTLDEVTRLFSHPWPNYAAFVMNLTAATTGARQGELLGLRRMDVDLEHLSLRLERSWERQHCVLNETTKGGRVRYVPITTKVAQHLSAMMEQSPWHDPEHFVFFHPTRADRPIDGKQVTTALFEAMQAIGISEEERRERFLDFHSWRHWFNSLLLNQGITAQKVQSIIGHLTDAMTQNYYHLDESDDVRQLTEAVVRHINEERES